MIDDPTLQTNVIDELSDETPPTRKEIPPTREEETPPEKDELRDALTELAGTVKQMAGTKETSAPAPTAEEIADFWKVYNPESSDKEFFQKWFRLNPDATPEEKQQAKELFAGVQKGLMLQSVTATRNYLKAAREEIDRDYGPIREYVEEQKREATRGRFYGDYPALKEPKFQKIIDATARTLDGKSFANEGDYFKALAEGAAGSIRDILPEFDLGAVQQTKPKPGSTPKLPRTSAGGGGGAGKGAHDALKPTGRDNDIDSLELDAE